MQGLHQSTQQLGNKGVDRKKSKQGSATLWTREGYNRVPNEKVILINHSKCCTL